MEKEINSLTNILFMDDEINNPEAYIVHQAIAALENEGYSLFKSDSLLKNEELWAAPVKDIFILDIDMNDENTRGSDIASKYRALYNDCKIIMFSARGNIEDWFEVANRHVFGYVDKNSTDPVEKLIRMVEKAVEYPASGSQLPARQIQDEKKVLIADDIYSPSLTKEKIEAILDRTEYTPVFCNLLAMPELLADNEYTAACIPGPPGSTKPSVVEPIAKICSLQPSPQVIIGVQGTIENRGFIIDCINWQPFRLLDLKKSEVEKRFEQAISEAVTNYGRQEIFEADPADLADLSSFKQKDFMDEEAYDFDDIEQEYFEEDFPNGEE